MKSASNLKKKSPGGASFKDRHTYGHMSKPALGFTDKTPDKSADRRVKVAKGLMIKH